MRTENVIKWIIYRLGRRLKATLMILRRRLLSPHFPKNADGKVLIHLGCGDISSPEFINVDYRALPHVHYICDVTDLAIFADAYADMVYACHVLEHISPVDLKRVLWEWKRVLKPGGILRLSVPDFDLIVDMYLKCSRDIEAIEAPLMGYIVGYNAHCSVFNSSYLHAILYDIGFREVRVWDPSTSLYHNFDDWASRRIEWNGSQFPISLNIEVVK